MFSLPPRTEYVLQGDSVTIPCVPKSALKPNIPGAQYAWLDRDLKPVSNGRMTVTAADGNLHVDGADLIDSSTYQCTITGGGRGTGFSAQLITYQRNLIGRYQLRIRILA